MQAPTTLPLSNRTVVVTGGFGALGMTIAHVAAAGGNRVALVDKGAPPSTLDASILAVGGADLASNEATQRAFSAIAAEYGPVDALLNVAGAFEYAMVADSSAEVWLQLYAANVLSTLNACRAAMPLLRPGSAIVNVAAAAARRGERGMAAYAAAKSGVLRLTESLAEELRPGGVRVNSVSPTIIDTPRNRREMPDADTSSWIKLEALARTMLFLASDATAASSGADVLVGG